MGRYTHGNNQKSDMNDINKRHTIMTVQPMHGRWEYMILKAGACVAGSVLSVDKLALLQRDQAADEVFIDEGFRTIEVRAAAENYGWTLTRGL
jgi:hypothetical protein